MPFLFNDLFINLVETKAYTLHYFRFFNTIYEQINSIKKYTVPYSNPTFSIVSALVDSPPHLPEFSLVTLRMIHTSLVLID